MKINTKPYGLLEIDERQLLHFPQGLLGFEGLKDYALMDANEAPFFWLQSIESAETAFILINPFLFKSDYEININDDDLKDIKLDSPEKALIFSIVTVPADGSTITANLQGPLVINQETREGKQAVLSDPRWKIKQEIVGGTD
ncbi:MAG: flagellar assembly protein FliW [Spirochaetaceae bacterium]|jgi:flagellar assembly factor FliW|nr:flagellar assembly protein FliW [Spirochaetaceae bacterium]